MFCLYSGYRTVLGFIGFSYHRQNTTNIFLRLRKHILILLVGIKLDEKGVTVAGRLLVVPEVH